MPCLSVTCYGRFSCSPWEACWETQAEWGRGEVVKGGVEGKETAVGI